jgi:histone H3/H4
VSEEQVRELITKALVEVLERITREASVNGRETITVSDLQYTIYELLG